MSKSNVLVPSDSSTRINFKRPTSWLTGIAHSFRLILNCSILVSDPYIKGNILVVYISCLVELKLKSVLFNFSHKLVGLYPNSAIAWYGVGCYYYLIKNYAGMHSLCRLEFRFTSRCPILL